MMKQPSLFGGMSEVVYKSGRGWNEVKRLRNYRKHEDKEKRCKNCVHLYKKEFANTYYKCLLMTTKASANSDIRLKCVCDQWAIKNQLNINHIIKP